MSEPVHAEHVARKEFSLSFRGFDQHEVRAFLASVAGELSAWEERERTLRARLADLEQRPATVDELDEAAIEAALGETATRIIHAAREAAAQVRARAETEAAQKLDEAEAILAKSTAEAAEANASLRADTEAALTSMRDESERKAASIVDEARATAAALVDDASATRDRTLRELADRRTAIVAEIEQLQAARDRLRAAHESVRSALDVAVLDVETAEMRASDILARVKPLDVPAAPVEREPTVREDVVVADEVATDDVAAEGVELAPSVDGGGAAAPTQVHEEVPADEPPPSEPPPEERRSSALRLLRPRTEAEGTPTAPPVDDPYEGVRIIRPDVTPESPPEDEGEGAPALSLVTDEPVAEVVAEPAVEVLDATGEVEDTPVEDTPVEDAAVEEAEVEDAEVEDAEVEDAPVAAAEEVAAEGDAPVEQAAGEDAAPNDDAPVDDLFARLRADRAANLAKATAVLAATDPSPAAPPEEESSPADVADAVDVDASPDLVILAARDAAVADAERGVVRSLKRALADEQNEVLDALRRLRGAPTVEALLPDVAVHEARYDAVLGTGAAAAATAGGEVAGGGGDAGSVPADIGRSLATDLRARVARSIDDAAGDVDTLAEAISATYREWKTSRAEPLARDVIAAAFASGTYVAASGTLRWVVDPAEGGCPDCEDNALAGETPKGTAYPTGQVRPPAHPGCRCALVPVS